MHAIRDGEGESALKIVRESNDDCIRLIESLGSDQVDSTSRTSSKLFGGIRSAVRPWGFGRVSHSALIKKGRYGVESWNRERKGSFPRNRIGRVRSSSEERLPCACLTETTGSSGKKAHFAEGGIREVWFPDCRVFRLLCDHYPQESGIGIRERHDHSSPRGIQAPDS